MNKKPKNSIYVKTLLWAYEKQHIGFTKEEMKSGLGLTDQEWVWINWMFTNGLGGAAPLIWSISGNEDYGKIFYLSADGIAAAVDYLELKEAQEGGRRATWIAITAIIIGVLVGLAQIWVQLCSK